MSKTPLDYGSFAEFRASQMTPLQCNIFDSAIAAGVDRDILEASYHPATCTCDKCRKYWQMAGESSGDYGPFSVPSDGAMTLQTPEGYLRGSDGHISMFVGVEPPSDGWEYMDVTTTTDILPPGCKRFARTFKL